MSFSYSGNPSASDLDRLRFEIGDTLSASPLLTDEELTFCIAQHSTWPRRKALALRSLGTKLLRYPDFALDRWRENRHQVAQSFLAEAKALEKQSASTGGLYVGGISESERATAEADTDFNRGPAPVTTRMDTNPSDSYEELSSDD